MWNPRLDKYELSGGTCNSYPQTNNDITRLEDIRNYYSVAGYPSGAVSNISANSNAFIPAMINLSKADALQIPTLRSIDNFELYFDAFFKIQSEKNLNFEVCLSYFNSEMTAVGNSVSFPIINDDEDIDIEIKAVGFNFPKNTKYVFSAFKNNNNESLKIIYNYATLSLKVSQEEKDATVLKTVENPLFVLLGGVAGTPAPMPPTPIPQNLTLQSLTLNDSLAIKKGDNKGLIILNTDGDFQVNTGNINMFTKRIKMLAYPSEPQDAASKNYVDNQIIGIPKPDMTAYLKNSGNNIYTGDLTVSGGITLPLSESITLGQNNKLTTIDNNDLVLYKGDNYLAMNSTEVYTNLPIDMKEHNIINLLAPKNDTDAANKKYIDDSIKNIPSGGSSTFTTPIEQTIKGSEPIASYSQNIKTVNYSGSTGVQLGTYEEALNGNLSVPFGTDTYLTKDFIISSSQYTSTGFKFFTGSLQTPAVQILKDELITRDITLSSSGNDPAILQSDAYSDLLISTRNALNFQGGTINFNNITLQSAGQPNQDNDVATKIYVDKSIQIPRAIHGSFQAFKKTNTFAAGAHLSQEFMRIVFDNGPVPNDNQTLSFSLNLSQFSLDNSLSFDISYIVNSEPEITFFSRTEDTEISKYSVPLSVAGLISATAYPISISFRFYNYRGQPVQLTTNNNIPIHAKLECVHTGSSTFTVGF